MLSSLHKFLSLLTSSRGAGRGQVVTAGRTSTSQGHLSGERVLCRLGSWRDRGGGACHGGVNSSLWPCGRGGGGAGHAPGAPRHDPSSTITEQASETPGPAKSRLLMAGGRPRLGWPPAARSRPIVQPYSLPHKSRVSGNGGPACFSARPRRPGSGPTLPSSGLRALLHGLSLPGAGFRGGRPGPSPRRPRLRAQGGAARLSHVWLPGLDSLLHQEAGIVSPLVGSWRPAPRQARGHLGTQGLETPVEMRSGPVPLEAQGGRRP